MADVRPDEVSAILREQLSNFKSEAELEEVGTILQVGDGVARIYGLSKAQAGELLELKNGLNALVLNLEEDIVEDFDEDTLHMRQLLKTELTEFGLSVRALNCLKTAEVYTLGELVSFKKADMLKFRNFGKKSLTELEELIEEKGLTFGFDTSKYNLDNE